MSGPRVSDDEIRKRLVGYQGAPEKLPSGRLLLDLRDARAALAEHERRFGLMLDRAVRVDTALVRELCEALEQTRNAIWGDDTRSLESEATLIGLLLTRPDVIAARKGGTP